MNDIYSDNLKWLNEKFPNKEILSVTDVMNGLKIGRKKALAMFHFKDNKISKPKLARELS